MATAKSSRQRVTLVTGATRGIGRAIVEKLAEQDHSIVGIARSPGTTDFPGEIFAANLADPELTKHVLAEITRRYEINGLVNNAGLNYL